MKHTMRTVLATAATAAALAVPTFALAPAASAATERNGVCESGEFCYSFNSGFTGSVSDFTDSVGDYGSSQPDCFEFKSGGNGQGQCVKNNAASVWNRTGETVRVYFNSGFDGSTDSEAFAAGAKRDLKPNMKNNNASHKVGAGDGGGDGTTLVAMSSALYVGGGGRITCAFDGYQTTSGRHEGIDIAKGVGADVRALTGGVVTYVNEDASLSTIAIYNASYDKTVIYLHSDPRNSLAVGQTVTRGEVIADEAARGAGSAAHTHVEMRPGRQTHASKSVDDYTLSNPDPTSFWNARGYAER